MIDEKLVLGSGGGKSNGSGSTTRTEADDTLSSEQFANVLDLLGEGEIEGLDDGAKSIFLEDTRCKTLTEATTSTTCSCCC